MTSDTAIRTSAPETNGQTSRAPDPFFVAARPYWHPVARSKDVEPGGVVPVILLGEELVVWRAPDGELGVVRDLCVHRGTRLSRGDVTDEGCIRCPYHAWEYAALGACTRIPQLPDKPVPATARVDAHQVAEHGELVWVCLAPPGEEARGIPQLPEVGQPGMRAYAGEPMDWMCQSGRQIENFCDIAHFSVVHTDVFGNPDVFEVGPHTVEPSDDGWQLCTEVDYLGVNVMEAPDADGRLPAMEIGFGYRVELPFAVHLRSTMAGMPYVLFCANQPVTAHTCRVYWVMVMGEEHAIPDDMLETMEQAVFHADRAVVETQRPEQLPVDIGAELHLPFDRMAVAYRRALRDLGFPDKVSSTGS